MPAAVHILGVRHHGPGSARLVRRALETLRPDAVLIEGPPDADGVLGLAAHEQMVPPVALLVYDPEQPGDAVFYPFAEFSPEWQAIRWGLAAGVPTRFIDLPRISRQREPQSEAAAPPPSASDSPLPARVDPLDALAQAAGFEDGEAWWSRLIEERRHDVDAMGVFDSVREAMALARERLGQSPGDADEPAREAHMRRAIRAAVKEGHTNVAVVCGAWHAPVLTSDALKSFAAKADDALLKGLPKRKTAATWIPWTYDRLAIDSGYGAGISSPGWYEHLWVHDRDIAGHWLTRVARLMRDEDLDASPASVIEAVRLAETLTAMRGRSIVGLEELGEATLSILCHANPAPMKLIRRRLIIGPRLGAVPDAAPAVPLQRDLAALQKSLRLKVSADEQSLDLDQRKPTDLERSRLLHRLCLLGIDWGRLQDDRRQRGSTFHELWRLQWAPELSVKVIEAARWGNTVAAAAAARVADRAAHSPDLAELTAMLDSVLLADLPDAVRAVIERVQTLSAASADVGRLMDALPPVAGVLRYGDVRKTDAALVEPVVAGLVARICAGLLPACASLDDDAAAAMRTRIEAVHTALTTIGRDDLLTPLRDQLARLGDADVHGLVAGRCCRLLLDAGATEPDAAATRLGLALSRGGDPAKASAWLEGFLAGSGMVLVHDRRLLGIIDAWVTGLTQDAFEQVVPIARRTFATFEKPERRLIGEKLKQGSPDGPARADGDHAEDLDAERAALVDPVLRLLLPEAVT